MRIRYTRLLFTTILLSLPGLPAGAGQCGKDYCWGALAAGPGGRAGRATSVHTAPDALARALKNCGAACDMGEVFVNSCAAIAEDSKGRRSFGWDADRATALAKATRACETGRTSCRIRIWACSK